jgi:hypothetical protein
MTVRIRSTDNHPAGTVHMGQTGTGQAGLGQADAATHPRW